jgi:hypothetical protein
MMTKIAAISTVSPSATSSLMPSKFRKYPKQKKMAMI